MELAQSTENVTVIREPRWSYHPRKYTPQRTIPPGATPSPNQPTWKDLGLESFRKQESKQPGLIPKEPTHKKAMEVVRNYIGITKEQPIAIIQTPLGLVKVDEGFVKHFINHHPTEHREQYIKYIKDTLEDPMEVWLTELQSPQGNSVGFRDHYISVFLDNKRRTVISVVEQDKFGGLLWTAWSTTKAPDASRRGLLKYKKKSPER